MCACCAYGSERVHWVQQNLFFSYTTNEVLDLLDDDEFLQNVQVSINPPNDGNQSAEDSDLEDGGNVNHLPAGILEAPAEFKANRGNEDIRSDVNNDDFSTHFDENQSAEAENDQNRGNIPDGPAPPAKSNVERGNKANNIDFLNHSKSSVVGVKLDSDAFQRCKMMRERKSDITILNSTEGTSSNDDLKKLDPLYWRPH